MRNYDAWERYRIYILIASACLSGFPFVSERYQPSHAREGQKLYPDVFGGARQRKADHIIDYNCSRRMPKEIQHQDIQQHLENNAPISGMAAEEWCGGY